MISTVPAREALDRMVTLARPEVSGEAETCAEIIRAVFIEIESVDQDDRRWFTRGLRSLADELDIE